MRVAILTISDTAAKGQREDRSGRAVAERCRALGWTVAQTAVLPDDRAMIETRLRMLADGGQLDLILTTGGTGIGPRDVTPEATASVCEKLVPGLAEHMRAKGLERTPRAVLSRGAAGVRRETMVVNLPGTPNGAVESLDAVAELLPHAVNVLHGLRHD
jgi:molybdenum cofactor synthesis domain-containing protein